MNLVHISFMVNSVHCLVILKVWYSSYAKRYSYFFLKRSQLTWTWFFPIDHTLTLLPLQLWDLRYHQIEQVSNQINEQQDRYKELLGRRQSFILHAVIAIISYITFGLVPPLVYGFSFRESEDRQLKLVVVGATSLLCILILAIAKAYTQRRPKPYLKTVATYVVLGFMVSGVSYVAGELVERLLDELGLFKTSSVPDVEMKPTGYGWTSYWVMEILHGWR